MYSHFARIFYFILSKENRHKKPDTAYVGKTDTKRKMRNVNDVFALYFVPAKKAVGSFLTPTLLMPVLFRVGSFDGRLFCTYSAIVEKKRSSKAPTKGKGTRKKFVLLWALF